MDKGTDGQSRGLRRVIRVSESLTHVGVAIRLVSAVLLTAFFIIVVVDHAWGVALVLFIVALWFGFSSMASIRRTQRFRSHQNPGMAQPT